eukprot:SAG31_NODE_20945_length_561_cov_1.069264_2_plen_40_part_01
MRLCAYRNDPGQAARLQAQLKSGLSKGMGVNLIYKPPSVQ